MNKRKKCPCFHILILIVLFASCSNEGTNKKVMQMEDGSILIPLNNVPIRTINMTDENGLKQGTWEQDDREEGKEVYYTTKKYNYKNDTLHGYYLEYKTKSADTLVYGNYFHGKKQGEWKYWATDKNEIEKIEIYEDGVIVK